MRFTVLPCLLLLMSRAARALQHKIQPVKTRCCSRIIRASAPPPFDMSKWFGSDVLSNEVGVDYSPSPRCF